MDDGEPFVHCSDPPVNIAAEKRKMGVYGLTTTTLKHLAAWHGILLAYAKYTYVLLEDEAMPEKAKIRLSKTMKMLRAVLIILSEVVSLLNTSSPLETNLTHTIAIIHILSLSCF